jgi:UDP-glucose 4-epimerase
MRVLVTGASGFAGAHMARRLADSGFDVTATYRRAPGRGASLGGDSRIRLVQTSLEDIARLAGPFEGIVHAAATSVWKDVTVDQMVVDNVDGTRGVLEAAAAWNCRHMVFLSSLSAFGEISGATVDESAPVVNPDAYGTTKYLGELMLAERQDRLAGLALRLPGVVGPGAHRNWLSVAAARMKAGETIEAFNLDAPYNNVVHVADVAALVVRVLERGWTGFDSVVLGAGGVATLRTVLERMAAAMAADLRIRSVPARKPSFTLSSQRAAERWGYMPTEIGALAERYGREA